MSEKIYVARVFAYETPSTLAKSKASVGMSVASKLNGNAHWVGTYVEGRQQPDLKIGFITAPQKFSSLEAAEAHAAKMEKLYPRGAILNATDWSWGEVKDDSDDNIHIVNYKATDVSSTEAAAADRGATATALTV